MKRTPEQAATIVAWLNMLDHCEAQLQSLGALPKCSYNLKTLTEHDAKMRDRRILRARKSRETIEGLEREVARFADMAQANADRAKRLEYKAKLSEERRLELLALAQELGCDCVPHKMIEAVKALKEGEPKVRQREAHGGGVDEHGNAFEFAADESGAVRWFTFNGRRVENERVAHKAYAVLSDGTRLCRIIRTGDGWAAIYKALTTPEDGDDTSEVGDGLLHDRAHVDKPDARAARSAKVRR